MAVKKVLITGSNGLLGQHLVKYYLDSDDEFLATSNGSNRLSFLHDNYQELDITNKESVKRVVLDFQPQVIINTAAATNVDRCEEYPVKCDEVNRVGVKNLVNVLNEIENTPHLIHISTDFIFDGKKREYSEEDLPNPISEYGKSKLKGEQTILECGYKKFTIIRTSLVYGVGEALNKGNIFLWAMSKLRDHQELTIVNDQFRSPTYVKDLCKACVSIANTGEKGIINIAGAEILSMHAYVCKVAKYVKVDSNFVKAITSDKLDQKANRPKNSGLLIEKARELLNYSPTKFEDSLYEMDTNS